MEGNGVAMNEEDRIPDRGPYERDYILLCGDRVPPWVTARASEDGTIYDDALLSCLI